MSRYYSYFHDVPQNGESSTRPEEPKKEDYGSKYSQNKIFENRLSEYSLGFQAADFQPKPVDLTKIDIPDRKFGDPAGEKEEKENNELQADEEIIVKLEAKLDKIQLPAFEVNFMGFRFSLIFLIARYLADFFILIPWFILKNLYQGAIHIYDFLQENEYRKSLIYFFLYLLDSLLPMSYIFLFALLISTDNEVMYDWISSCFILFCSFLLLVVYYSLVSTNFKGWREIFTYQHLDSLGLGMCQRIYVERNGEPHTHISKIFNGRKSFHRELTIKLSDYSYFKKRVREGFDKLTIDDTYFYFSYFFDDLDKNSDCLKGDLETKELFAKEMVFVQNDGETLLYKMKKESDKKEEEDQKITCSTFAVFGLLMVFKIIIPYIYVYEELNNSDISSFAIFSIMLFYVFIMSVIFPLLSHEDLRRRANILEYLNKMILFEKPTEDQILSIQIKSSNEIGAEGIESPLETNDLEKILKNEPKLDVTCLISLETWDNCRRLTAPLDFDISHKFELVYIFLGIYFLIVVLVLLQDLFEIYLFFSESSTLNSPLIVLIFTIDFSIMLILFFHRIYYGTIFNETFTKHKDSLEKLTSIFQDLIDMYEIYFNSKKPIKNVVYNAIFNRIMEKFKRVKNSCHSDLEAQALLKKYVLKLAASVNRIKSQVAYDESHYKHRFLGILTSDFQTILAEVSIVIIPLLPTLFSRIMD